MNSAWRSSPREVDLLSWFTSYLVPIVFGGIATTFGITVALTKVHETTEFARGSLSVVVMAAAFGAIIFLAPSRRTPRRTAITVIPIGFGWIATALTLTNEWGTSTPYELRSSHIVFALLLGALAPYLSARRILIVASLSSILLMGVTALSLTVEPHPQYWPFLVNLVLGSGLTLVATVAVTTFSFQVVSRMMRWASSASGDSLSSGVLGEAARRAILRQELASVSERALPLLERVTASGVVTDAEREEALRLAESLRSELVERSNRSWLESLTLRMNLTVIDPERLAERMNPNQRSAILGILTATMGELASLTARPVIELRRDVDGATAVAVSADHAMPDGHKLTLLAPYYVSLVATVDDVEWKSGEKLHLRFRVPPHDLAPPQRHEPSPVTGDQRG